MMSRMATPTLSFCMIASPDREIERWQPPRERAAPTVAISKRPELSRAPARLYSWT